MSRESPQPPDHERLPAAQRIRSDGELRELRSLIHLMRPYGWLTIGGIVTRVLWALGILVPGLLIKWVIDVGIADDDQSVITTATIATALLVVVLIVLARLTKYWLWDVSGRAVGSLQRLAFDRTMERSSDARLDAGDVVSRLTNDAYQVRHLINDGLPNAITSTVKIFGSLVVMLALDWDLALVTVSVVPLILLATWIYRRFVDALFRRWRATIGTITGSATDSLSAVMLIQSYNQQARHRRQFADVARSSRDAEYRTIKVAAVYSPTVSIIAATAYAALIIYGGTQVVDGNSDVGTMVAFFGYLGIFIAPLAAVTAVFQSYEASIAALGRVHELIDRDASRAGGVPLPDDGPGQITLDQVTFATSDGLISEPIDLHVEPASIVAFVGDASSGRPELARVIGGVQAPRTGVVRYDGVDGDAADRRALFGRLSYIAPSTTLFDGTVRDNLLLGASGGDVDQPDDTQLRRLLDQLFGPSLLERLPDGLDTEVGRDGRRLPVGARQSIIIARAIAGRPKMIVLDGATDGLDAHALATVTRARATILADITIVAATSQPLIADYADHVVVLDRGRIVEAGLPSELLERNGAFAELSEAWRAGIAVTG